MLPIIALHECFVCTNLMYSQWTISNYYPYRKSKSPDKSLDYLEVYIWTHHKTIIFLQHRICRCSSMTELDILNLHHSVPKSSKSVYNGRGGGHILKSPSWFFFLNSLPEVEKLLWNPFPLTGSYTSIQASSLTIEAWTQCWRALKGQSMTVNFVLQASHSNQLLKPGWFFLKHGIDFNLDISIFM